MRFLNDGPPHTVVLCPAPDQLSLLIRIGTGIVSSSYALRMDIFARKGFFGKMRDKRFNGYDGVLRLLGFDVDMNVSLSSLRKKRRLRHHGATRLLLHDWFFCRPPTLSSFWSKAILLHQYWIFLLPANSPTQSPASISDFRCQPHQRDDALYLKQ